MGDDLTMEQFEAAKARGVALVQGSRAESVHCDAGRDRVIVRLTNGVKIGFAPRDAQGLQYASCEDLTTIELEPFGLGIHFPRLNTNFYVPALLEGMLGSRSWMAAQLDAAGGRARSSVKAPLHGPTANEADGLARLRR